MKCRGLSLFVSSGKFSSASFHVSKSRNICWLFRSFYQFVPFLFKLPKVMLPSELIKKELSWWSREASQVSQLIWLDCINTYITCFPILFKQLPVFAHLQDIIKVVVFLIIVSTDNVAKEIYCYLLFNLNDMITFNSWWTLWYGCTPVYCTRCNTVFYN